MYAGNAYILSVLTEFEYMIYKFQLKDEAKTKATLTEGQKLLQKKQQEQIIASMKLLMLLGDKQRDDFKETQNDEIRTKALEYYYRVLRFKIKNPPNLQDKVYMDDETSDQLQNYYGQAAQRIVELSKPEELKNLTLNYGTRVSIEQRSPQVRGFIPHVDPSVAESYKFFMLYLEDEIKVMPADSPTRKHLEATYEYVRRASLRGTHLLKREMKNDELTKTPQ